MRKITYADKETLRPLPSIAERHKITSQNMNEVKDVVNEHADEMQDTGWVDISSLLKPEFAKLDATSPVKYRKVGKVCKLRLLVTPTADFPAQLTLGTVLVLPEEARPSDIIGAVMQGSGTAIFYCEVQPSGNVIAMKYRNTNAPQYSPCNVGNRIDIIITYLTD